MFQDKINLKSGFNLVTTFCHGCKKIRKFKQKGMLDIFAHFFKKVIHTHLPISYVTLLHCLSQNHLTYAYDLHNTTSTLQLSN